MKKKVLFADDNLDFSSTFKEFFSKNPWDIELAENGVVALDKAMSQKFDLIILDINMPFMNGTDTLKAIKLQWQDIPVLAFTGDLTFERRKELIDTGFHDVIQKPIELFKLHKIIEHFLSPGAPVKQPAASIPSSTQKESPPPSPVSLPVKESPAKETVSTPIQQASQVKDLNQAPVKPTVTSSPQPVSNVSTSGAQANPSASSASPSEKPVTAPASKTNSPPNLVQNSTVAPIEKPKVDSLKTQNSSNLSGVGSGQLKPEVIPQNELKRNPVETQAAAQKNNELEEKLKMVMASKLVLQEEINKLRKENEMLRLRLNKELPSRDTVHKAENVPVNPASPASAEPKIAPFSGPVAQPIVTKSDEGVPTFELD